MKKSKRFINNESVKLLNIVCSVEFLQFMI
jgi:hypothetical protein